MKKFSKKKKEFINKIVYKILDISTFWNEMELINLDRIKKRKKDYYSLIKDKYELIFKNHIQKLKEGKELNKAVEILFELISRIFLEEKNNNFLDEKIGKLDDKVKNLIYNQLLRASYDKNHQKMKEYIFEMFLGKKKILIV